MFDGRDDDALSLALALPATVCVDSGCADGADPPYHASLLLRLSTAAATRLDVANAFCAALKNRAPQLAGHLSDIRYAVHEAIANAVMHGNLGLDSGLRSDMAGLARFAEAMEQRLADPVHARLPVIIAARTLGDRVLISVEDQGMGFRPQDIRPPASAASGGMGLAIIAKCCRRVRFSKGGRRITMMFGGR
jgi:anti-sigma regulatory factor (Ser/Thr protein kinase)